jgi:XTP/dITP diphosphohydrolase
MSNTILIATHNKGKIQEFSRFLQDTDFTVVSLSDLSLHEDVSEDGKTYEENSQKKAVYYAKKSGIPALSDDGGLEVSALNGEPGIKSRRWLGHDATDEELIKHMQKVAESLPENNRYAKFVTVVSFALPDGKIWSQRGEVEGIIIKEPFLKMNPGYPYRSFFYLPTLKKYYHENDLAEKEMQEYNHRYKAFLKLLPQIQNHLP